MGKRVTSSVVVTEDGEPVGTRAAFRRMGPYIVVQSIVVGLSLLVTPGEPSAFLANIPFAVVAFAGLVMLLGDDRRQSPWDKFGRTLVVRR